MSANGPARPRDPARHTPVVGLGSTLDFMRLLWATDHELQKRSKRMEVAIGLTGLQRILIRLVGRFPDVTAGRLAELVHLHPSTLTGVLKRLAERGYLVRTKDRVDARVSHFTLTPEGDKIDGSQAGTVEAAVRRALARLPPEHVDAAREVLEAVAMELAREDR